MNDLVYQRSSIIPESKIAYLKKEMNDYLFAEYGFDKDDANHISEEWPFQLQPLGVIHTHYDDTYVFEFSDESVACFAVSSSSKNFYPINGMTFDDLCLQIVGSEWIGSHDPYNLDTIRLGDETVPPLKQRQAVIESLANTALPADAAPRILEGLFLRSTATYLALVQDSRSGKTAIVGSAIEPRFVDVATETAWRKLSFGIGQMIVQGQIAQA